MRFRRSCQPNLRTWQPRASIRPQGPFHRQWSIPLTISAFWALICRIEGCLRPLAPNRQVCEDVVLALIEALSNAFSGNQDVAAGQHIVVALRASSRGVMLTVKDPGIGFAHRLRRRQLIQSTSEGGRGLYLIEQVMDRVSWSNSGNAICMERRWRPEPATALPVTAPPSRC